jgi:eukaryotic-like serine/threonine-protein kinase
MNAPRNICAECGAELARDAVRGLCARCLLRVALESQADPNATVTAVGGGGRRRSLPNVGERFGTYRIVRLLGQGGMGVVYEAEEQDTGRRVALKVLGRQFDSSKDRGRFLREGRLAASINHPNSVYVFGTEEIEGAPTIAMELVAGGTLAERLKNHGPMPVAAAVDAILQIVAGLEAAQAIGILHRDIKPGNCFEDGDGTIKIGDFGLSISTAARAETNITADGAMVGTPAFCSPEQLRGEELSARSDMYSVGGTLFFLLTGRVPFEGQNIVQLTANVLEKPPPSPREFRKEIPKGLANAVVRCLAKQSADRFKSYDDLREALAPYGSTAPTPATLSLRFLAGVFDTISIGLVGTLITWLWFGNLIGWLTVAYDRSAGQRLLLAIASLCSVILYYAICEGIWGAAAGKALCRLRVVRPDKNPPGFFRAALRALMYIALPALPSWIVYRGDPRAAMTGSIVLQQLVGVSAYVVMALLFCTARRRNGFAAVQDLATKTRVIAWMAPEVRPLLAVAEIRPPAVDATPAIGPYHVLETLESSADEEWLLGYDLRLLRKVWIRTLPAGTPPMAAPLRSISRPGRLRWLMGRRSAEENWDAFEAVGGKPLLQLIAARQSWRRVRFWLYDLAKEIGAAEKDSTLPKVLALDRVWITGDGRAKLLDFPAPGLAKGGGRQLAVAAQSAPLEESTRRFLADMAAAALEGRPQGTPLGEPVVTADIAARTTAEPAVPLPLYASNFLKSLPGFPNIDAVVAALTPLLRRVTTISRLRRAAVVAGCAGLPVVMGCLMLMGLAMMRRAAPDVWELSRVLQLREMQDWSEEAKDGHERATTDRQFAIYITSHYRDTITNETSWESPIALSFVRGDHRRFAEQSIAEHPAPTKKETAEADAALRPQLDKMGDSTPHLVLTILGLLAIYVCIPAWIAALAFRDGLVLRMAGMTFVRWDGRRASRLRVLWRGLVAWCPLWLALLAMTWLMGMHRPAELSLLAAALVCGVVIGPAIISVALPERGLPDRLAGTWPVPR